MGRIRSTQSRKASLTSFKELGSVDIAVIGNTRANGSGSRARALTRQDFLMPEDKQVFKERINAPIVFESAITEEERPATRGTGVVILPHRPTTPSTGNPVVWDQQRIHAAVMLCRQQGFLPGCIVAKRQLPGSGVDWKVTSHFYWGLVTSLNMYIPGNRYDDYAPLNVRWFERANHQGQAEEQLFPGQLYLIHAALTEDTIRSKMTAQG